MANQIVPFPCQDPEYVEYLFSPQLTHDCYFIVGNCKIVKPERIGAVKMMLLAHSPVFRAELQDSKLREKGDVPLEDFYPDTFKHLLRYVYGYDNTGTLTFDEADNLLYAAEKYMMDVYKQKLATRLMSLLSVNNICSLLNNPACFRVLELNAAITKILQYETDKVLASPLFLNVSPEAFVKILEQDAMNVAEIEVWRAAIRWAKEKTGSEDGHVLRQQLAKPLKKIRVCTISPEDLCSEVVSTDVLTDHEFKLVSLSRGKKRKHDALEDVCNEMETRKKPRPSESFKMMFDRHYPNYKGKETSVILKTKNSDVELLPFEFLKYHSKTTSLDYKCECTVQITDLDNTTDNEVPIEVKFCKQVKYNEPFKVPIMHNGQNVKLLSNRRYNIRVTFTRAHSVNSRDVANPINYDNEHLKVTFEDVLGCGYFCSHFRYLQYLAADSN